MPTLVEIGPTNSLRRNRLKNQRFKKKWNNALKQIMGLLKSRFGNYLSCKALRLFMMLLQGMNDII